MLHAFAYEGSTDQVKLLLSEKAITSVKDKNSWTPLMYACQAGHKDIVQLLVASGANVNSKDNEDWTPLHLAAEAGRLEVMDLLIRSGAEVRARTALGLTPLHLAPIANRDGLKMTQTLISNYGGVDIRDKSGRTPLHHAVRNNSHLDILKLLLDNGSDVNARDSAGETPFDIAVKLGNAKMAEMLQERSTSVDASETGGLTSLPGAPRANSNDPTTRQLKGGADISAKDKHAKISQHRTSVSISETNGITSLHDAARRSSEGAAICLLEGGADVNAKDKHGQTPLHCAVASDEARREWEAECECFLDRTSNLIRTGIEGDTTIAELLLRHHSNANASDNTGNTPLHLAARMGYMKMVSLLLKYGADPLALNQAQETPVDVAVEMEYEPIKKKLLKSSNRRQPTPRPKDRMSVILEQGRNFYCLIPYDEDRVTAQRYFNECVFWFQAKNGNITGELFIELALLKNDIPAIAISGIWPDNNGPGVPQDVLMNCDVFVDGKFSAVRKQEYLQRFVSAVETRFIR
jgi:serine/threonine-protein phosphatase 6 regulatory ankyrin repeat subunit B